MIATSTGRKRLWPWSGQRPSAAAAPAEAGIGFQDLFGPTKALAHETEPPALSLADNQTPNAPPPPASWREPDPAPAATASPLRVTAEAFCAPRDLEVTPNPPGRALAIGSCFMEALIGNLGPDADGITFDFILANGAEDFPDAPPDAIDAYDFQVVQIPLRFIINDDMFTYLRHDDEAGHEAAFKRACRHLDIHIRRKLSWNSRHGILTFVLNFMQPQHNAMGRFFPRYTLANPAYFVHSLNQELERLLGDYANAHIVDLDGLSASFGRRYVQDDTFTAFNHNAGPPRFLTLDNRIEQIGCLDDHYEFGPGDRLGAAIVAELRAMLRTVRQIDTVKLVVVDLDDTLWNGVSGDTADVGADMVEGWPLGVIEALATARKRGIILAIASKNDDARIRQIWHAIFHNRLKLEDFGAIRINWRPKTENMAEILGAMNLLPRNVLFIDDNPAERAAMLAAFPDIRAIGDNPFHTRRILLQAAEMQPVTVTAESGRRTEMIQAQMAREQCRGDASPDDFARDQQTVIALATITGPLHPRFARAFELINKTNQFNTTGQRWKMEEMRAFFGDGGSLTVFDVEDRFTAYGLVGVVLIQRQHLVQWVMSCRVIGMKVEQAVMAALVDRLRAHGARSITANLLQTDANRPCQTLFSQAGFEKDAFGWALHEDSTPQPPSHVTVKDAITI